jgi:Pol polyprotein, beta-barrel domain
VSILADESDSTSLVEHDEFPVTEQLEDAHAVSANPGKPTSSLHTKVYDSGCTRHITPYLNVVKNFTATPPKTFQAANKQSFNAVVTGEMTINIPNGADISQLRLTEVLYSPEVGYTLVSVGRLDQNGLSVTFGDRKCTVKTSDGKQIVQVQGSGHGLYRVTTTPIQQILLLRY